MQRAKENRKGQILPLFEDVEHNAPMKEKCKPLLFPSYYYLPLPVKSFLNLLFVPPFQVYTVTSDPEPLNLKIERNPPLVDSLSEIKGGPGICLVL